MGSPSSFSLACDPCPPGLASRAGRGPAGGCWRGQWPFYVPRGVGVRGERANDGKALSLSPLSQHYCPGV